MEILDVYDKYKNLTNKKILKNQYNELENGEYTLFTYVAIFNSENEMLIQKRQSNLDRHPNLWDISASGNVLSGETSDEAIERKHFEELGHSHKFIEDVPYITVNNYRTFGDVYIINCDIDINNLRLDYNKVQNVTWASKDEILQLIEEEKFIPYTEGFIELLFFNKNIRGVLKNGWKK